MAIAIGVFVAIVVFFRTADIFVPLMLGYAVAIVIWAIVAESAATRAESVSPAPAKEPVSSAKTPLPH